MVTAGAKDTTRAAGAEKDHTDHVDGMTKDNTEKEKVMEKLEKTGNQWDQPDWKAKDAPGMHQVALVVHGTNILIVH